MRKSSIKGFVAEGLLTKARFVSGRHMIETLSSLLCPTVPIILMIIALNRLEISECNRTIWRENIYYRSWIGIRSRKIFYYTIRDTYLSAEIAIPRHGYEYPQYARVIKCRKDQEGNPAGIANNPNTGYSWIYNWIYGWAFP